ncbi:MAG TPA: ABC transporter permease, partial [Gemmatimonadaceae bacterium]
MLFSELKAAAAAIRRSPGAPIVSGISLALGMALATVVFSMADALFLHPLPYGQQERLYRLYAFEPETQANRGALFSRQYFAVKEDSRSFETVGASRNVGDGVLIGESGDAFRATAEAMTPNFLSVFDVKPVYGRAFGPEDIGTNRVLISAALWQSRFAASRDIVGNEITLNGRRAEVIGILPRVFMSGTAIWFPLGDDELRAGAAREGSPRLTVTGKAVPGATREAINAE